MGNKTSTARSHYWSSPAPRRKPTLARLLGSRGHDSFPQLPRNVNAERAVLGAILLDGPSTNVAFETLKPEDFFFPEHGRIFERMSSMADAGQAVDLVTLGDELQGRGELEQVGGAAYVAQLVDGVPRVTNIEFYARIVKEHAMRRSLADAGYAIQQVALDEEEPLDEVLERLEKLSAQYREAVWAEESCGSAQGRR